MQLVERRICLWILTGIAAVKGGVILGLAITGSGNAVLDLLLDMITLFVIVYLVISFPRART